ncbi:MAG: endonuclease/exonuclease/phosphatase family protein [Oscillospiraceae bacterium]|nr:endonuclease/exonuclease/phosphatase family protein [Oscillospiraceae bacterium]
MKIVTFNLRVRWDNDGTNSFIHRLGLIDETLRAEMPDVICFQEMKDRHRDVLQRLLPEYTFVGHGNKPDMTGEMVCTAVKKPHAVCGFEAFWLSPTPQTPGSRFDGQSVHPRICLMTLVRTAGGEMLRVCNTHLDYIGVLEGNDDVEAMQMAVLLEKLRDVTAKQPYDAVVCGDLNVFPHMKTVALLNSWEQPRLVDVTAEIPVTFHEFGARDPGDKIDYLFATEALAAKCRGVALWVVRKNGIYLSDHYPVCAEFDFG